MKTWIMTGLGLGMLTMGGVAMAQGTATPPTPPTVTQTAPQPADDTADAMHPGMHEHGGWHHEHGWEHGDEHGHGMGPMGHMGMMMRMHMHPPPPPSKAAHFRFRKGDAMVDVKCADDEPTKACVDAASTLLDKLAPTQAK